MRVVLISMTQIQEDMNPLDVVVLCYKQEGITDELFP